MSGACIHCGCDKWVRTMAVEDKSMKTIHVPTVCIKCFGESVMHITGEDKPRIPNA